MIHNMKVQVRSCAVTGMPHPGKLLTCIHFVTWRDLDRAGLCMGIDCIPIARLDDDVIASQLLKGIFLSSFADLTIRWRQRRQGWGESSLDLREWHFSDGQQANPIESQIFVPLS